LKLYSIFKEQKCTDFFRHYSQPKRLYFFPRFREE
jgi:hypothetical protein